MQWEYIEVSGGTVNTESFILELNGRGSLGWEVVAMASVDPTIGINKLTAILKRQVLDWPPPSDTQPGRWHPDPTARFAQRHWDGLRWTQHVIDDFGRPETDYPNPR